MSIVLVTNIPAPYRQPLYGELARRLGRFSVIYEAPASTARDWGNPIADGYDHQIAVNAPLEQTPQLRRARAVRAGLSRAHAKLVISTGFGASAMAARGWCAERRVPFVGLSGATAWADRHVVGPRRALRAALTRSAAGWIAYGPAARHYLLELGADPEDVVSAGNPFGITAAPVPRQPHDGIRRIGFVGQLHWRKGWWIPVQAAAVAASDGAAPALSIVGDGPGASLLRRLIAETPEVQTDWAPKRAPSDMETFYDSIDLLVVPSLSDQWPIVASEAAARGVPVVCTEEQFSGLPASMATAGPAVRVGSVHAVARLLIELRERGAYTEATRRVMFAREAADPVIVAKRWSTFIAPFT